MATKRLTVTRPFTAIKSDKSGQVGQMPAPGCLLEVTIRSGATIELTPSGIYAIQPGRSAKWGKIQLSSDAQNLTRIHANSRRL